MKPVQRLQPFDLDTFAHRARVNAYKRFNEQGYGTWTWAEETKWQNTWEVKWQKYEANCGGMFFYYMTQLEDKIFDDAWKDFVRG